MMNKTITPFDPLALETPYVFFTGKGGVGKTSAAAAAAITLARAGKRVLIVSTDPASNLDDVFERKLGAVPAGIPGVEGLFAANLDPVEAAGRYREKVVGPYRGILPDAALAQIEEQLSGACTVEIAAFDEFAGLLAGRDGEGRFAFDHVVLDTAPTGHTLRLLQLPKAWSGFLEDSTHGASCLGPLSGLGDKKDLYAETVSALSDPLQTTIVLVARPDDAALAEAARASKELKELGIGNQRLVLNGLLSDPGEDAAAQAFKERQDRALRQLPEDLKSLETGVVQLQPRGLTGIAALGALFGGETEKAGTAHAQEWPEWPAAAEAAGFGLLPILRKLEGKRNGVIMTMGKGGVGKTTVAAALALCLAERGKRVHLTTTDPAAHLAFALGGSEGRSGLTVSRIDPKAAAERYREEVLARSAPHLDDEGLALLREDLASPCTEEIAVFRAFAEAVEKAEDGFVVLDTAPTGHTLLLLDAAEAYHREVVRSAGDMPEYVGRLLPRLRNPKETDVVLVTLPEATPVLEAERLQEDLRRAGISPGWWVVNQSWQRVPTANPVLAGRAAAELEWIERVRRLSDGRFTLLSWQPEEPVGEERLLLLENR